MTRLVCAFSREPGRPKTYVQQAIADHGEEVWRLLQEEGIVFVCGEASRMAPEVRQAFIDLFVARTGALDEAVLHLNGAAHRVDHTAELDEAAVPGPLDDAPVMGVDGGVDQIAP